MLGVKTYQGEKEVNKVEENCRKESNAKFYYASQRMFFESKVLKVTSFFISIIPIVLSLITMGKESTIVFIATMVSFAFSVTLEFLSSFRTTHKERSVLLRQLYNAGITGCAFSKIEYDREQTNFFNELAIRKAESIISLSKEFHIEKVPKEIDDKYTYLYICRTNAASNNYLMSRMYAFYICSLVLILGLFISFAFIKKDTFEFLQLIIQFYPLILPIIRNINSCYKAMKYYIKISADIDNYFASKDKSSEKRARFISYIQGLEFEAMRENPEKYNIFEMMFSGGLKKLNRGVTNRFLDAVEYFDGVKMNHLTPVPLKKPKTKNEIQKTKEKTEPQKQKISIEQHKNKAKADLEKNELKLEFSKAQKKEPAKTKSKKAGKKETTKEKKTKK